MWEQDWSSMCEPILCKYCEIWAFNFIPILLCTLSSWTSHSYIGISRNAKIPVPAYVELIFNFAGIFKFFCISYLGKSIIITGHQCHRSNLWWVYLCMYMMYLSKCCTIDISIIGNTTYMIKNILRYYLCLPQRQIEISSK